MVHSYKYYSFYLAWFINFLLFIMKKGQSYINFYIRDKPNHPISVACLKAGYKDDSYIIYASHMASDYGWTIDGYFLGYTLKSAIKYLREYKKL